jgi:tRNA-specific 2-thiouridylase
MTAKDKTKDQSYFLWQLNQKQLSRVLFPIGDYTKKEVRQMAKKWNLPNSERPESQEICFTTNLYEFLKSRIYTNKGPIITNDGKKIGEHEGLAYYTIGQRKGIKIGGIGPFYVVKKDFKNNALIVAQSEQASELFKKEMVVKKVNWITGKSFRGKCKIKIRYMTKAVPAVIKGNKVVFDKKQRAITPGQSAVFYKNNELLGGGIIC